MFLGFFKAWKLSYSEAEYIVAASLHEHSQAAPQDRQHEGPWWCCYWSPLRLPLQNVSRTWLSTADIAITKIRQAHFRSFICHVRNVSLGVDDIGLARCARWGAWTVADYSSQPSLPFIHLSFYIIFTRKEFKSLWTIAYLTRQTFATSCINRWKSRVFGWCICSPPFPVPLL